MPQNTRPYRYENLKGSFDGDVQMSMLPEEYFPILNEIQDQLFEQLDLNRIARRGTPGPPKPVEEQLDEVVNQVAAHLPPNARVVIKQELLHDVRGFGPLQPLLNDPTVSEIMVNGPVNIYVERNGNLEKTPHRFRDERHLRHIIDRILSPIGRRVDEASPTVDARLPDGSRVNVVVPPITIAGAAVTIRKFRLKAVTSEQMVSWGTMSDEMCEFLERAVSNRLNILVIGGTGSGKTTTLNYLSNFIGKSERILTIEDAAELQLQQEHVVSMETRPTNVEGKGEVSIRDLVRNALRMRPDRIVVGEVRGGEALDMLQAMNTGHDGCLSTMHANSPRDALSRLETMVLMAGMELPLKAIREQIASAIDLIVHQARIPGGYRKVLKITEVTGMESDVISLQDLYVCEVERSLEGSDTSYRFRCTGIRPVMRRCIAHG